MTQTSTNVDRLIDLFNENIERVKKNSNRKSSDHDEWMNNSISFRQITTEISKLPKINEENVEKEEEKSVREIKLYSKEQFRSHINRLYPFHLDFFSDKLSSLDFDQHRMGLYIFYDVNQGFLINDLEKESKKKTQRGKNMKVNRIERPQVEGYGRQDALMYRYLNGIQFSIYGTKNGESYIAKIPRMNGLLLNEHRMFNECAKEYATKHFDRDYQSMKTSIQQFIEIWLQRKTNRLNKSSPFIDRFYSTRMTIPLNSYDSLTSVNFNNLSTLLRLGTIPQLTIPDKLDQIAVKCSDNHDRVVSNRFNSDYRHTNLVDDSNILVILAENPSIDVVLSKTSFSLLIDLFSESSTSMTLPMSIREFQYENLEDPTNPKKKKILFIDKPLRQRFYTKRELNTKYFQRSFRSLLISQTGGKRDATNNPFHYVAFTDKFDYPITEIKKKIVEKSTPIVEEEPLEDEDEDEDDEGMIISTDGDIEEQQKLFQKSKQKIIHSAPIVQERTINEPNETNDDSPVPIVDRIKMVKPVQGNYEYSLWQLGSLQILLRTSFHGFYQRNELDGQIHNDLISCYAKLEYQPQFGYEQITDKEYRSLWLHSYLRRGSSVLLGRINAFTQQLLKVDKMTYENIEQNLKECQIDMLKPITKVYGLLYGLQILEPKNYLLRSPMNENKIYLFQPTPKDSNEEKFDLQSDSIETNELLVESDRSIVPWIPLTPTLLLPYHLDFERIPLTFCPRNKRCYDISLTIPPHRKRRIIAKDEQTANIEKKKRKKAKKKRNQQRKKSHLEQSN